MELLLLHSVANTSGVFHVGDVAGCGQFIAWSCYAVIPWSSPGQYATVHRAVHVHKQYTYTYTHTRLTVLCPGLSGWDSTRKVKPIWILLKQGTVSDSGISWAICKSATCSRQITTPAPHHSAFYRPDALPAAQPTASKHWRHQHWTCKDTIMIININLASVLWHRWLGVRKNIWPVKKLSDEVLVWLSVCSEVQIACIWSSWCHCIAKPHHLLPRLNPHCFYLSGTGLPRLSWKSGR